MNLVYAGFSNAIQTRWQLEECEGGNLEVSLPAAIVEVLVRLYLRPYSRSLSQVAAWHAGQDVDDDETISITIGVAWGGQKVMAVSNTLEGLFESSWPCT